MSRRPNAKDARRRRSTRSSSGSPASTTFEEFFADAELNPRVSAITGVVCGVRVEEIEDPLMQKIRYLDKLIDELAKGKAMSKILREA